ncbi:MAG: LuxR C-terminal-related transcriptional regulator [Duganella sp.]
MSAPRHAEPLVILSQREQEYLLHAIETAPPVDHARQFYLWTQGPLQALLPHQVLVALHFDAHDQLLHVECQHSTVLDAAVRTRLADRDNGIAVRLARLCRQRDIPGAMLDTGTGTDIGPGAGRAPPEMAALADELRALGLDHLLAHGTGPLPGGASFFVLFGLPQRPHARHARFLALLLPAMHLMLGRLARHPTPGPTATAVRAPGLARPVSAREAQILHWVREGKSNHEIGQLLGISGLTVKNHLQRVYRLLGVSNRAHAIARCAALRLLAPLPLAQAP